MPSSAEARRAAAAYAVFTDGGKGGAKALKGFADLFGGKGKLKIPSGLRLAALSPDTQKALRGFGYLVGGKHDIHKHKWKALRHVSAGEISGLTLKDLTALGFDTKGVSKSEFATFLEDFAAARKSGGKLQKSEVRHLAAAFKGYLASGGGGGGKEDPIKKKLDELNKDKTIKDVNKKTKELVAGDQRQVRVTGYGKQPLSFLSTLASGFAAQRTAAARPAEPGRVSGRAIRRHLATVYTGGGRRGRKADLG